MKFQPRQELTNQAGLGRAHCVRRGSLGNVQWLFSVLSGLSLMFWEWEDKVGGVHSNSRWEVLLSIKSLLETDKVLR